MIEWRNQGQFSLIVRDILGTLQRGARVYNLEYSVDPGIFLSQACFSYISGGENASQRTSERISNLLEDSFRLSALPILETIHGIATGLVEYLPINDVSAASEVISKSEDFIKYLKHGDLNFTKGVREISEFIEKANSKLSAFQKTADVEIKRRLSEKREKEEDRRKKRNRFIILIVVTLMVGIITFVATVMPEIFITLISRP